MFCLVKMQPKSKTKYSICIVVLPQTNTHAHESILRFYWAQKILILFYLYRVFNAAAQRQARESEGDFIFFID